MQQRGFKMPFLTAWKGFSFRQKSPQLQTLLIAGAAPASPSAVLPSPRGS